MLISCLAIAGCGDTCVVVVGIFPNASTVTNPPSCQLGGGSGSITIGVSSTASPASTPSAPNLRSVIVTVRGLEAHESASAAEDAPDWQELAPELVSHPVQIDLMAAPASSSSCARILIHKASVRAGTYRQIRLRLASDEAGDSRLPPQNECAGAGLNCVVANNGEKHPLALKNGARDLLIGQDRIADGFFNVVPGLETSLSLTFDPYSSLAVPSGSTVQIAPVISAATVASCDSAPPSP